ncbi:hypothetical protein PC128_g17486 [Phytophthora cactorum]|nr:hypothetical protein PC128_g17486 [Phytophthora cactorum]KAG4051822.1 hypothetical protein PC123_g12980 [Phytophthora cactorum]
MRNLAGSRSRRLRMRGECKAVEPSEVVAYSDANFAADKEDRTSVTGGFVTVDGMDVVRMRRKQGDVSLSTREAEYSAASVMDQGLLGISEMLGELGFAFTEPMAQRVDNQAPL